MSILNIVGGGTTGLTTALILRQRFPNLKINLIKSEKIGILGVGEGATEHWNDFASYCNLSHIDIIKKCDATVKVAIVYENFTPKKYVHNVTPVLSQQTRISQYQAGYAYHIVNHNDQIEMSDQNIIENKIFEYHFNNKTSPSNQFHFNTFKLNEYLIQVCKERNINIITDDIKDVILNEKGFIESIKGADNEYKADFFIDCTGFQRLLISKLGAKWQSYKKYLRMNEAIAFPTKDTDEYPIYTTIIAMNNGWMWRTPVWGRWGNGYVYDNNYMNAEQAKKEVESFLKHEIEIFKNVKFDPGCLDKTWIKNCLALGISASFVEPLEASTISVGISQAFLFMHLLENYNEKDIEEYNKKTNHIMENIRDFVFIHYLTKKENTQFWKDIKNIEMPETLKNKMEKWKYRLPIEEDFKETSYYVFWPSNFINVMYGLDLFNKDNIKKEYLSYSKEVRTYVENCIKQEKEEYKLPRINHKKYLQLIRNENSIN
jgi:flavin-dependent dehydrogenase